MTRLSSLALAAMISSFGVGCAGARTNIVAQDAHYPVSLSQGVRDADGTLVPDERKVHVATFHQDQTAWGLLYSGAKLTPNTDISREVDRQVRAAGGDAVVNLRVAAVHCRGAFWPLVNLIPIWPACTKVRIQGDIVTVIPKTPTDDDDPAPQERGAAAPSRATRAER